MAGIGDSWGTREELLHPRGPDGRWIKKGGIAKGIIEAVLGFLRGFSPRTFQNQNQSSQYLHNISGRQGKKRFTSGDLRRLYDLPNANEDLRDGVIDNPSTGRFVEMMDRTETELPDDVILTRIVPTETFGYTRETATGTNSDTDPGIREMSGRLIADRGYSPMTIGNVDDVVAVPQGSVRMVVAAKKGTKVNVPGGSASDSSIFLTRDQPLRITKIKPDGAGGWTMYVTTDESRKPGETPEAIGGPRGLQVPPTQEREAAIRDLGRIGAKREGRPDEVAEQADIEARQRAAEANAQATPTPSPAQVAERQRVEALPQQPAPGEPPPRTETPVGRVGEPGTPASGGAPAQTPEATVPEAPTVPRRSVDLRLAVRDANIPSPSAGSRRKQWNEAYLGVATGKKDPIDAIRELDSDIETLRRGGEPGGAAGRGGGLDEDRPRDIESFQKLRDLIAQEYGLPGAPRREERTQAGLPKLARGGKTRMSQREQEAEERNRAAGASEAVPAPTPAKKAPAKKAAKKAAAGPVRTKDQEDRILSQASKLSGPARNSEEERLLGEAEAIRARRAGAPVPVKKAPAKMGGRSTGGTFIGNLPAPESEQGPDLDKMTKPELLALARREGVQRASSMNKDQLKAGIRRMREIGPVEPGSTVGKENRVQELLGLDKKPTVAQLRAYAREQGIGGDIGPRDRRDDLIDKILSSVAQGAGVDVPEDQVRATRALDKSPVTAKKVARGPLGVPNADTVRQALVGMPADDRFPYLEDLLTPLNLTQSRRVAKDLGVRSAGRSEKPEIIAKIVQHFEGAGDVEAVARLEGPPAPVKKAAKAAVPGAAPGTAAGKITAGRIQPGMRVLVGRNEEKGYYFPSTRKTGQTAITVDRFDRISVRNGRRTTNRLILVGHDDNGNEIRVEGDPDFTRGYPGHQTFILAPEPGAAPAKKAAKAAAPDSVQVARERQAKIDRAKGFGNLGAEIHELIHNEASAKTLASRIRSRGKQDGLPEDQIDLLARSAEGGGQAGHFNELEKRVGELLQAEGVSLYDRPGSITPFDRTRHRAIDGDIADGTMVHVVRPGREADINGERVNLERTTVEPATPAEIVTAERAKVLVPEGSVTGTRTDTPVDNAPRKRELRQAWIAADIQPPSGPVRTQTEEIRDRLLNGDVTPEEGIRMMESEIALNKEDLAELDAHLREADLTDRERKEFQDRAVKLTDGIREQEKASKFLRLYFKEEAPVVSLKEAKEVDPVSYEFLKDATPDDMREAAKEAGLDAPSGDTVDEMFTDLLKQVARNELARRAAKKAAKKAAPAKVAKKAAPEVPRDKERVDAQLLAEGLELDPEIIDTVQRGLDGEAIPGTGKNPTPRQIAENVDGHARARSDHAGIMYGNWDIGGQRTPEEDAKREQNLQSERLRAQHLRDFAERIRGVRRKKATPAKAAPAKVAPEVQVREEKIDDLKKRIIDQALEGLQGAKSRDKGDDALEGLTLDELRRLADASGIPPHRSKRGMRDAILAHFFPEQPINVHSLGDLPSREAAHELLAPLGKPELLRMARELSVPGAGSKNMTQLRGEIVEATTGRRLDSIAIRGFEGASPERPEPAVPRAKSLGRRVTEAGIDHPGRTFSDVDSAVTDADARLRNGESHTDVARRLRERAARVAKADIMEEGRRFPTELDRDTLLSIRKSNADYLRRVATHVQQEGKASAPAKKAAKKAAPELPPPGEFLELARAERPFTEPSPSRTGTSPVGGTKSTKPILENSWGGRVTDVHFHNDGIIGQELRQMGDDRSMDVDGEPLANVVGKLATDAVMGRISQDQLIQRLKALAERLPEGSTGRRRVESMAKQLDAPERAPLDLPNGTPGPITNLMQKLSEIPLARGTDKMRQRRDTNEMDTLRDLAQQAQERYPGNEMRQANWLSDQLRQKVLNHRHESEEGKFQIDRAVREAMEELERIVERLRKGASAPPAAKKATPRLTAIPGGGTSRGGGKRPKLTVVRNEQGEFAVAWV